ncbi:MAG: class I SAM-dependent methyltransferase [Clostridiales bacterium]|nr:class I SAM-dependent methyltransferase [Clostridiales bacterium]
MDLRLTFNSDPDSYDRLRPTYSDQLFKDLIDFSKLDSNMEALEIGIGTGQASTPILETGCRVTAIEIGDQLAEFSRIKFSNYNNLNVIIQDFEKINLDANTYDLIYSASAFHWIPIESGLPKVLKLLKSGGVFAWFSIQPSPAKEHWHIHDELQKVYSKYSEYFSQHKSKQDPEKIRSDIQKKLTSRIDDFKKYSFTDVYDETYCGSRTFKAKDYAELISTFSDHKIIPSKIRTAFLDEIVEAINKCGGEFTLSDTVILCMGRKK